MIKNIRGQSTTEFVILGSIVLMAFSFLINYSEKLNRQQSYIQQTFRAALKEARSANNSASYSRLVFRRAPNVLNPMELGQLNSFSASANVLWADGKSEDEHGVSKYQLNEGPAIDIAYRDTPGAGTVETSNNIFINNLVSEARVARQESPKRIVTTRFLSAQDRLRATVGISGGSYSFTHTLGPAGKYYPGENSLERSGSMQ